MSDEIQSPSAFDEYQITVPGLGNVTVIAPEGEPGYRVRLPDGQVTAFPSISGDPSPENALADIVAARTPPSPAPEPTDEEKATTLRAQLLAQAAARRYEVETGGITVEGVEIATDRQSQAMLSGAITFCDIESQAVINWKAANGWFQTGEDGLRAIALAVGRHVQAQFTIEAALATAINAAADLGELQDLEPFVSEFVAPPEPEEEDV